ncbi:MAG TPA: 4Fe-4S dicluster domain-containing protein [Acidimicrobiia bacterium]|nr:4Fe-4S dicluster domain-containing protein [Acidimicrobiia bacterium]
MDGMGRKVLDRTDFGALFAALTGEGYTIMGPTVRDHAIVYDELAGVEDLPIGWTDVQEAGEYRLERREDQALFGYAVGQHSWKRLLFPPTTTLFEVRRSNGSLDFVPGEVADTRYAFLGVRACELAAIGIQDRVFLGNGTVDRTYQAGRRDVFIIALNCMVAGGTCFCVSMGTGPRSTSGYDLVLTEVIDGSRHEFVLESGSEAGERLLAVLPGRLADDSDAAAVDRIVAETAASMGRSMDIEGIKELLYENLEHPRWEEVASRCLSCTNCTLVCPTCFCSSTTDTVTLDGESAQRSRRWDSCFTLDFSALHGVPVRNTIKDRYRQWMTHKLASWYDQFGSSGCVGCGRCITWCPVGIDITEEVAAIRATHGAVR